LKKGRKHTYFSFAYPSTSIKEIVKGQKLDTVL